MSTFTTAKNLEQVARGGDVGTWDTPENSNWGIVDAALGQAATIGLNNSNVALSSPQYQCAELIFNSTLTGSVAITFPSTFTGPYIIQNLCTGTSAFTITLQTTVAGGQVVGCPGGDSFNVINDGTNIKFHNIGRIGTYWDYAGSSVPNWVSACTVPPFLNCDGTTFSSATYPVLAMVFGGTTLPDRRGMTGYTLNQGTGRVTSASGGLDGNTLFANKTTASVIGTSNLPAYTPSGSVTGSVNIPYTATLLGFAAGGINLTVALNGSQTLSLNSGTLVGNAQGGVSNPMPVTPSVVYGISMVRAG